MAANVGEFGGEVLTETSSVTTTVVSVNPVERLVVLKLPEGGTNIYQATPQAQGLKLLKLGDRIRLSVAEELAVFPGTNGVPSTIGPEVATRLRARLPKDTEAIATEVVTLNFVGQIAALDDWNNTVTFALPAGLKTIHVSEYVNLGDVNVGDSVSVRSVKAAALELDNPGK